jgi:hypothetical protein
MIVDIIAGGDENHEPDDLGRIIKQKRKEDGLTLKRRPCVR